MISKNKLRKDLNVYLVYDSKVIIYNIKKIESKFCTVVLKSSNGNIRIHENILCKNFFIDKKEAEDYMNIIDILE